MQICTVDQLQTFFPVVNCGEQRTTEYTVHSLERQTRPPSLNYHLLWQRPLHDIRSAARFCLQPFHVQLQQEAPALWSLICAMVVLLSVFLIPCLSVNSRAKCFNTFSTLEGLISSCGEIMAPAISSSHLGIDTFFSLQREMRPRTVICST